MPIKKEKLVKRAVTEQDLELNPELVENGVEVGTVMKLPEVAEEDELDIEDSDEDEEEDEEEQKKSNSTKGGKVTFQIMNPNVISKVSNRVFSHYEHGKNYKELADSFEKANTLLKPTLLSSDVDYKDHVDEIVLHNRSITTKILSRKDE